MKQRKKVKYAGYGLRLSFGIILLIFAVGCALPSILLANKVQIPNAIKLVLGCASVYIALGGILQIIAAIKGKTKKWGNTLSIVIGCLFFMIYFLGLLAIIGGVKGNKSLRVAKDVSEPYVECAAETTNYATDTAQDKSVSSAVVQEEPFEYIKPKLSPKAQKGMFLTVIISYVLLMVVGILFVSIPAMSKIFSGMGICAEASARAYGVTVGAMWLALLPSVGYYIAFTAPLSIDKKKKIIISVVSGVLSVALCVAFFIVINKVTIGDLPIKGYFENDDKWFIPASMVLAFLGLTLCYVLTLFRLNPAKIKSTQPEKCGDGFIAVIKYVFAWLGYGVMKLAKSILSFKEKQPEIFIFLATFLFTWLIYFTSFIFSIIIIAVLIGTICMWFGGVVQFAYSPEVGNVSSKQIIVDGKVLTKTDNIAGLGYSEVYTDEYGNVYYSDDGGKTVISATDRNIVDEGE